jgi:hypothetical protein
MKRGLSGKTRRGSPPLPRQRKALRVVQATLVAIAAVMVLLAGGAWNQHRHPLAAGAALGQTATAGLGEVLALAAGAVLLVGLALAMGLRVIRGPEPDAGNFR